MGRYIDDDSASFGKIGKLLNRPEYLEEARYQFMIHIKYLMDKRTGLWYHGWTFEGNHNYAEAFWARGNCWLTIAIPEIIEILELSKEDALRKLLIETLEAQVRALKLISLKAVYGIRCWMILLLT